MQLLSNHNISLFMSPVSLVFHNEETLISGPCCVFRPANACLRIFITWTIDLKCVIQLVPPFMWPFNYKNLGITRSLVVRCHSNKKPYSFWINPQTSKKRHSNSNVTLQACLTAIQTAQLNNYVRWLGFLKLPTKLQWEKWQYSNLQ